MQNPDQVLDILFYENPQAMWIYRLEDWKVLKVNNAAVSIYGYTREEFLTKTVKELRPQSEIEMFDRLIPDIVGPENNKWDARHMDKNGKVFWVQVFSYPVVFQNTKCRMVTVVNLQETLEYRAEISRKAFELQKVLDNSLDVICTFDADGRFLQCSKASEDVWGYTPEELIGKSCWDFIVEEDHLESKRINLEIMSGLEVRDFQNRYIKSDGSIKQIVWSARWDSTEQTMFCIARDATEKNDNERKEQASRIATILESITDGFFTLDGLSVYFKDISQDQRK